MSLSTPSPVSIVPPWFALDAQSVPRTAVPAEPEPAAYDPECLNELRALSESAEEDVLGEVIALYQTMAPVQLAVARQALAGQDALAMRQAAHSLKGSSAQFGAQKMQDACAELENAARHGKLEGAATLLAAVEYEFHRLITALAALSQDPTS